MCGIIGYLGSSSVVPILLSGLERLEYRGYDSAGIAVLTGEQIEVRKAKGHLAALRQKLQNDPLQATLGIGHTRWATHGEPSDQNSHPHVNMAGTLALVHNGIIENYQELKTSLIEQGYVFSSQTDTEVIVHLLDSSLKTTGGMLEAIYKVLHRLQGSYALAIMSTDQPDRLYCARKDSPLVVGKGAEGNYIASDIPAILEYTRQVYLLDNEEVAVLSRDAIEIYNAMGARVNKDILHVDWDVKVAEKGGFPHFMMKEMHEEPEALRDTIKPNILTEGKPVFRPGQMPLSAEYCKSLEHVSIVACGTAYHAGLVAKRMIEKDLRIPVEADIASEYRYRDPLVRPNELCIIISQSGETADTIAAMREAKARGAKVLAVCNVVGSTISREADHVCHTWAGPEIAVASTKAYVSQLMMLYAIVLDIGQKRGAYTGEQVSAALTELLLLPEKSRAIMEMTTQIQQFAAEHFNHKSVFYIGRGLDYCLAQEASLKLKEISYIHSEALAAGELKHGTIALIEKNTLVVAMCTQEELLEKTISNMTECRVRGAKILAVTNQGNRQLDKEADYIWEVPVTLPWFRPVLAILPLQLFAYYTACANGCDVDKPRNLAKSVTVE